MLIVMGSFLGFAGDLKGLSDARDCTIRVCEKISVD